MSYVTSMWHCHEALKYLSLDDTFDSRLERAFAAMGEAEQDDTFDEIWEEWKALEKKYHTVSSEIYKQRNGVVSEELKKELNDCAKILVGVIVDWIEFNGGQISKRVFKKPINTI